MWLLAVGCLAVSLAVEAMARVGLDRMSKIQRRVADEYRLARTIGRDGAPGRRRVLFVGNSLLDEDIQFDRVREGLAGDWDARRFVIEQTFYYDWYYGVKRLLHEGARPDVVVLMLTPGQWTRPDIRGDYSAQYLMSTADLPAVARDLGLNATQAANLLFSNVSKFWGARAEIRNFVLGRVMPDLGRLMNFSSVVALPTSDAEVAAIARDRLVRLDALIRSHGARFVVLLPAVTERQDGSVGFLRAAQASRVTTLRPVVSGTLGADLYRDAGFHLNPTGAAQFTERLIPVLKEQLAAVASDQEPPMRTTTVANLNP
jgi:hypothetical protein